jgi:hypothetical protein
MPDKKESLKAVRVELLPEKDNAYSMMSKIRKKYHQEIKHAKIALVYKIGLKPDKDGHLELGQCHKTSDLQKEFAEWDFVIFLNKESWNHERFSDKKKKALLDHELCHAGIVYTKDGHRKRDERKRFVYRVKHHDLEEFNDIVERHGIWKHDLELFAEALQKGKKK